MTLSRPEPLFHSLQPRTVTTSSRKDELTHVSEILAYGGIPVADSLKERMLEELAALIEDDGVQDREDEPQRSARGTFWWPNR